MGVLLCFSLITVGVIFRASPCTGNECRRDIVFVLDASTSVGNANFNKMLQFVKDFLTNTELGSGDIRVGTVTYSTEADIQFDLNMYKSRQGMFDRIDRIVYRYGSTNTAGGIRTMRNMFSPEYGDREGVPNICIVITDGISNINSWRTIPEAEFARSEDIHIYVIGIGLKYTTEVDAIASVPASKNSFNVQSFDDLKGIEQRLHNAICQGVDR